MWLPFVLPSPNSNALRSRASHSYRILVCLIANLVQLVRRNKSFKVQTIQSFVFSNVSQSHEEYEGVVDKPNNTWVLS